mmetsp:Transcript_24385/g.39568  ORF Transcript_24385/g.39568 Transcript_24385/m.39568 type:complete len:787 (+) Transcript_24385:462-2822(+)|eukprot:CAMPEP_0203760332 /NCGR_PEP_ID=MMETSP0098-20131031/13651_1 /ASSEMBLY_ACC=CAM_ASM_000208 /TAXON_ID=96639 /ORGANISM=" , Strain NY0313808BC1" /LENGTH=786 /DNA_ID=CAMNT_0050653851 /DNA_START=453 /DNA_END=2813 /DNA_ORIENTATION=-
MSDPIVFKQERLPNENATGLSGGFEGSIFNDRYQRNNKRGGLKNLRCFPACSSKHKERGFCGRSVFVNLQHPLWGTEGRGEIVCRAEFISCDQPGSFTVGDEVGLEEILALDRSKDEPIKPLIRGEVVLDKSSVGTSVFEFNRDRKGWHYGWASNKHTCNSFHCLTVYVFEKNQANTMICRLTLRSPHFMLFCRRRRRFLVTPTAPVYVPAKAKQTVSQEDSDGVGKPKLVNPAVRLGRKRKMTSSSTVGLHSGDEENTAVVKKKRRDASQNTAAKRKKIDMRRLNLMLRGVAAMISKISPEDDETLALESEGGLSHFDTVPQDEKPSVTSIVKEGDSLFPKNEDVEGFSKSIADCIDLLETNVPTQRWNLDLMLSDSEVPPLQSPITRSSTPRTASTCCFDLQMTELPSDTNFSSSDDFGKPSNDPCEYMDSILDCHGNIDFPSEFVKFTPLDKERIVRDLGKYLLTETGFTKSIQSLNLNEAPKPGKTKEYRAFVSVLEKNVQGFMSKHKLTLDEFDEIFDVSPTPGLVVNSESTPSDISFDICTALGSGGEQFQLQEAEIDSDEQRGKQSSIFEDVYGSFKSLMQSKKKAVSLDHPEKVDEFKMFPPVVNIPTSGPFSGNSIPDHSGCWRRGPEGRKQMIEMRMRCGIPWILTKMLEYMESKYSIQQVGPTLHYRMRRKLLSNGTLTIQLDNVERPFGLQLPILTAMSQMWTHRGFVRDDKVFLVHTMGRRRLTRVHWLNESGSELYSNVILEVSDTDSGEFVEVMRARERSFRELDTYNPNM